MDINVTTPPVSFEDTEKVKRQIMDLMTLEVPAEIRVAGINAFCIMCQPTRANLQGSTFIQYADGDEEEGVRMQ